MSAADGMMLWTGDYLADTRHLSTTQHGAYLLILMAMWRAGGSLPNDDTLLAKIAGLRVNMWHRIAPEIMALLTIRAGKITQKRLFKERKRALQIIKVRRTVGASGGRAKALKTKKPDLPNASGLPHDLVEQNPSIEKETKTKTQIEKKEDTRFARNARAREGSEGELFPKATEPKAAWPPDAFDRFWKTYPHKVGKQDAIKAFAVVRRSGAVTFDRLMFGLDRYIAEKPPDRHWCNPATFLRHGRWDDEPGNHTKTGGFTRPLSGASAQLAGAARLAQRMRGRGEERDGDELFPPGEGDGQPRRSS